MNSKRKWIFERCGNIALWDNLDDALVGVVERCGMRPVAVYDRDRMIKVLSREMSPEDAEEYIEFNIVGAYHGELTPFMLDRIPSRQKMRGMLKSVIDREDEIARLRNALQQIAENKDEPYARDFASDILARREVK